jgi:hypothetical protein
MLALAAHATHDDFVTSGRRRQARAQRSQKVFDANPRRQAKSVAIVPWLGGRMPSDGDASPLRVAVDRQNDDRADDRADPPG